MRDDFYTVYDEPDGENALKIRHILLLLLAVLAIAFMQPLITFLGGMAVLFGVGTLIFQDLSAADQDAVERRVLSWLRRARTGSATTIDSPVTAHHRLPATPVEPALSSERLRRGRDKAAPPSEI